MKAPPLSNNPTACKCPSPRSGKEVADSGKLSVTADPQAGDDDDDECSSLITVKDHLKS